MRQAGVGQSQHLAFYPHLYRSLLHRNSPLQPWSRQSFSELQVGLSAQHHESSLWLIVRDQAVLASLCLSFSRPTPSLRRCAEISSTALCKNSRILQLSLYDIVNTPGVAADLSHIATPAKVVGYLPPDDGLKKALTGADIVVIPAGVPRKPGVSGV